MKFLVSTGYAWNRLRTLVLGLSGKLLILANNLNLRFVGNATVITQQIRNAWDSYGLPFPQMLLNAAWLHNEPISDTEIVDETPGVDASRPTHKARALQFTGGSDYVSISKTYPSTDTPTSFEVTLEIITGDSIVGTQDIFCTDDAGQAAGIQLRIENYSSDWRFSLRVGNVVGRDTSFAVEANTRYILVISYDGTNATLTVNEATNLTITPTSAIAGAGLIMLGRRYTTLGNYFNGILGYVKIKEDNIVIGEYAFEEGEGTVCYNRVMNNFHGTINNATISTFRVEDVRITNGDQGTFLNTDGYSPLNVYTSDFSSGIDGLIESRVTASSVDGISDGTTSKDDVLQSVLTSGSNTHYIYRNGTFDLSNTYDVSFEYYIPSVRPDGVTPQTIDGIVVRTGTGTDGAYPFSVLDSWQSETIQNWSPSTSNLLLIAAAVGEFIGSIDADGDVYYLKNIVVTQPNVYVPRPRVTDIPLYNAGKYAYYIPDHANNYIDLNTAFAGLTKEGDWMEFGIATVGTGEPDSESGNWVTYTGGNSRFFANITSGVDFRFFGPNGGQNQMKPVASSIDITNNDFYLLRVTKTVDVQPPGTSGIAGQLDLFDRNGNLIVSHDLNTGSNGNEGTYSFDRFFPSTYGTDFILAYLKLSDGTVWNGVNDFNGGVNITNTGTGNITKIFFESVDEDVLGNPLTYKGQVAQPLSLVNSNGVRFGDQEQIELTNDLNVSDFTEIAYVYFDSTLASGGFMRALFFYDTGSSSDGWVTIESNELRYGNSVTSGSQSPYPYTTIPNFLDTWQKVGISRTGSEIVIVVGDEVRTADISAVAAGTNTFEAIGRFGNNPQGDLAWISFHSKGMTAEEIKAIDPYNMDTDSLEVFYAPSVGHGSTIYDLSGNNNHGTITNATLSDFWIKQDQFHWNLKKGFDYYTRFADDVNQVQYNERLAVLDQNEAYTIRTQFYFAGFPYPDSLGRGESVLFSADIDGTVTFAIWIEGNTSSATFNVGYFDGSTYHTVLLLNPMKPGPYYLEIVKDSLGYDFTSISLNGDSIDVNQAGSNFTPIIYQTGISCRAVDASADRRWYGGIKFFEIVGQHYLSEDNGFVDTIGNLTLDVPNTEISTKKDRIPYAPPGRTLSNPAGKWHNDAETQINFPHTAKLHMINEQFNYKPFFYKNAQLDDATAAYSMRKVIADYEGPLVNVVRSSDLQARDFYPDSRGDLDTTAITNFVNESGPVLDDYTGAAAAYSLRKLRTAYTGSAIEVRRSSNGDTQDIGFDANGDLDSTALLSFVNAEYTLADEDFSSSTGWNLGTGLSITGGVLRANTSSQVSAYKNFGDTGAQQVRVTFTILNYVSGNVKYMNFATATLGTPRSANGTYTEVLTLHEGGNANHGLQFNDSFVGDIDDFEIVQLTADGHVTTWYDQTENDPVNQKNATQSDPAEMPLVVSGGTLVTENSKAAIQFDGVDDEFTLSNVSARSFYAVLSSVDGGDFVSTTQNRVIFGASQFDWQEKNFSTSISYTLGNQALLSFNDSATGIFSLNGVTHTNTDANPYNQGSEVFNRIGSNDAGSPLIEGTIQEFILFDSDQSTNRTGIESNIGRYYTIDGFADGRVATWYDQANANNAKQATADKQPLIVNDGVLVTENSKPAIQFDGVDDVLMKSAFDGNAIVAGSSFIISVSSYRGDSVDTFNTICHIGGIEDSQTSLITIGYNQVGNALVSGKYLGTYLHKLGETSQINTQYLNTLDFDSSFDLYQDGVLATYNMNPSADVSSNVLTIGGGGSGNNHFLAGNTQELIIYDFNQSINRHDMEKNVADYYDITISGNAGVESWVKNVSFADMYQSWFDYEYLHKLFANFEVPNQVNKILAYVTELTIEQRETIVYPYLKEDYHPIYTPYQQRVQADSGDTDAGKTNTLNKIDNI